MPVRAVDIAKLMGKWAPLSLAAKWDNVGLQIGDPNRIVRRILVALDVDANAVAAAKSIGAEMIVAHHPLIFQPLTNLRYDRPQGALLAEIIQEKLVVYCAHTNLDQAWGGTDDLLAKKIGLTEVDILHPTGKEELYKLVVFVPQEYEAQVRSALGDAGAGWIGNYSHCTFRVSGTGTFQPQVGSQPFIGTTGKLEQVSEYRLETVTTAKLLPQVLEAMFAAHPYEEVAYDLFRMEQGGKVWGFGRIGRLVAPLSLDDFAGKIKADLGLDYLRVSGNPGQQIMKVAVCGGSGSSFFAQAGEQGADVLVTGDIKYHDAAAAAAAGLAVIDAGHQGTEQLIVDAIKEYLHQGLADDGTVEVYCHHPQQLFWIK
ncbi:MAG: Nif3-like dinuclear metal center hexameric protein [bacterium]|jgi:dinuclear metal center YbgI/SA1388 family protein